jgi:hypothetical protein
LTVEEVMEEDNNIPSNPSHFYVLQDDYDAPESVENHTGGGGNQGD